MNTTEDSFLKDVAKHSMEVLKDDGVYRHIRFRRPETYCMFFDLITWPGHLAYTGDMGSYTFRRLPDMFEFFRTDREYAHRRGKQLSINLGYWSEKVQAADRNDGIMQFSPERFKRVINEVRVGWMRERGLTKEQRRELWNAVDDEVLSYLNESVHEIFVKAQEFSWSAGRFLPGTYPTYSFEDLWDHRFTDYTHRFVWCCYALAWGIQKYDEAMR